MLTNNKKAKKPFGKKSINLFSPSTKIPGQMVWDLIIVVYLSIADVARLDKAMSNKAMREAFFQSFSVKYSFNSLSSLEKKSLGVKYPLFYGLSWRKDENFDITSNMAKWLESRKMHIYGIQSSEYVDRGTSVAVIAKRLKHLKNLTTLSIFSDGFSKYFDEDADDSNSKTANPIFKIIPYFPALSEIFLHCLSNSVVDCLSLNCPNITKISGTSTEDISLQKILISFPNISEILCGCKYSDFPECTGEYPSVTMFCLHNNLGPSKSSPQLTSFDLIKTSELFPNLTKISMPMIISDADANLDYLRTSLEPPLPNIQSLLLESNVIGNGFDILVQAMPNLSSLKLGCFRVNLVELGKIFLNTPLLTNLTLTGFREDAETTLLFLSDAICKCVSLKTLTLENMFLQVQLAEELTSSLESITFNHCNFGRSSDIFGWDTISVCLKKITVYECSRVSFEVIDFLSSALQPGGQMILDEVELKKEDLKDLREKHPNIRIISVVY